MENYKDVFKRETDRLSYLYAKANTKSKKKMLAYDLIFFERMFNSLVDEEFTFPWNDDEVLIELRDEVARNFIQNVLDNQDFLILLIEKSFDIFLENGFTSNIDYGKKYHRISDALLQKYIVKFYNQIDTSLKYRFIDKFNNEEILLNNNILEYDGLFFPFEYISKNMIFITGDYVSVEEGRILVHEMGHDFEIMNAKSSGVTNIWNGLVRTVYPEVCSSFFEYGYINYLIDNNLYIEDSLMLKRKYLDQVYSFLSYLLIIFYQSDLRINSDFNVVLSNPRTISYANKLLDMMNSIDKRYELNDEIAFRSAFVYGIGKLLAIYVYDSYVKNPKEFLSKFRTVLLEYKDTGVKAFLHLGITEENLLKGDVLKRTLKDCK